MAFFGMQLKPGKAYNVGIPETKRLHVTGACLASGNGKAAVSVMVEGKNFTVACLNSGLCFFFSLKRSKQRMIV